MAALELGEPLWLAGLALVPAIRALHRWRGGGAAIRVPAAFLWQDAPTDRNPGRRRTPPDPAWRRRALAAGLLVGALAAPQWHGGDLGPVEVLVDNRQSLLTRESDGRQRAEHAADALASALGEIGAQRVRLVPRVGPLPPVELPAEDRAVLARALASALARMSTEGAEPALAPLEGATRGTGRRWLLGDGAGGPPAEDWQGLDAAGPFERVVAVGRTAENQGLARLAARPALEAPERLDLLAEAANPGPAAARRTLILSGRSGELARAALDIPAGGTASRAFRIPRGEPGPILARLEPPDALPGDDSLSLDLTPVAPVAVARSGDCGDAVSAFVSAHPALTPAREGSAPAVRIWCAPGPPDADQTPTLWLPPGEPLPGPTQSPRWLDPGLATRLASPLALTLLANAPTPPGRVLLAAGEEPLVLESQGTGPGTAPRLTLRFDTGPAAVGKGELPLILDLLLERLLGRNLLSAQAVAWRPDERMRVAPGPLPQAQDSAEPRPAIPLWPLLLAIAAPVLGLDLWRSWGSASRGPSDRSPAAGRPSLRAWLSPLADRRSLLRLGRTAALALAIAALILPFWPGIPGPAHLLVLLDDSDSMPPAAADSAWAGLVAGLADLPRGSRLSLIRIGARPVLELDSLDPTGAPLPAAPPRQLPLTANDTDLAAGLGLALSLPGPGERGLLLLISDGLETRGDVRPGLRRAAEAGIPALWRNPVAGHDWPDAWIAGLATVESADGALSASVRIGTAAPANVALTIALDDRTVARRQVVLPGDAPLELAVPLGSIPPGPHALTARVQTQGDARPGNDRRGTVLAIQGRPPVALVASDPGASALAQALAAAGWDPVLRKPEGFDPSILADARVLILEGLRPDLLAAADWQAIARAVSYGGLGLIVLGGPQTFGAGGYRGSVLEGLLPVTAEAPERRSAAAVVYAVDKSGSMAQPTRFGVSRLDLSRTAVAGSARSLGAADSSALVVFDASARTLLPLAPRSDTTRAMDASWVAVPGGGTRLAPAVEASLELLAGHRAGQRILVLVSDGQVSDPEEARALGTRLAATGVETICLWLGDGDSGSALAELASAAGGRFQPVADLRSLPGLMQSEVERRLDPVEPGPVQPQVRTPLPFPGAPANAWPPLMGYAVTRARADATVYLAAPNGDPLLAARRVGAGQVLVLPAGLGVWAPDWPAWDPWGSLIAGLAGWAAGAGEPCGARLEPQPEDPSGSHWAGAASGTARLLIERADPRGRWSPPVPLPVRLGDPRGGWSDLVARPVAPGLLSAQVAEPHTGLYRVLCGPETAAPQKIWYQPDGELHPPADRGLGAALESGLLVPWTQDAADGTAALPLPRVSGTLVRSWALAALGVFLAVLIGERIALPGAPGSAVPFWRFWRLGGVFSGRRSRSDRRGDRQSTPTGERTHEQP